LQITPIRKGAPHANHHKFLRVPARTPLVQPTQVITFSAGNGRTSKHDCTHFPLIWLSSLLARTRAKRAKVLTPRLRSQRPPSRVLPLWRSSIYFYCSDDGLQNLSLPGIAIGRAKLTRPDGRGTRLLWAGHTKCSAAGMGETDGAASAAQIDTRSTAADVSPFLSQVNDLSSLSTRPRCAPLSTHLAEADYVTSKGRGPHFAVYLSNLSITLPAKRSSTLLNPSRRAGRSIRRFPLHLAQCSTPPTATPRFFPTPRLSAATARNSAKPFLSVGVNKDFQDDMSPWSIMRRPRHC